MFDPRQMIGLRIPVVGHRGQGDEQRDRADRRHNQKTSRDFEPPERDRPGPQAPDPVEQPGIGGAPDRKNGYDANLAKPAE